MTRLRRFAIAGNITVDNAGVTLPGARALELPSIRLRAGWLSWLTLPTITLLSFALNAWSLSKAGYGNTYYAAAVRSMTMSWKNFFFGAFDPGGFITVDKPPVFLWVGALSARVFGYSSWSLLLPSAFAGAASVALLWLIVRRHFGTMAASIAAVVLALTPISVSVNRLNLPEPFMILALVGAAGATIQSFESKRWWAWTALAGFLVGVAFNTKMLAAWIPGPAFAFALVVATRAISWPAARQLLGKLAVLGIVTLVVSGSWMMIVDAWPASARPYIGGSTNNTVLDLALGYNGFGRVDGASQVGAGGRGPTIPRGSRFANRFTPPTTNSRGGFAGPGGIFGGLPGAFRMFDDANGGQIGWLLPFAVGGGLLALWHYRRDPSRRAFAALFLGWIGLYGGVFSYAHGIFHSYYTSAIAPGVAAMVGVGSIAAAKEIRRNALWLLPIGGLVVLTMWVQLMIAGRTPDFYSWVHPYTLIIALLGLGVTGALALARKPVVAGLAISLIGLLFLPAAWSVSAAANTSLNTTLPQAGPQVGASGSTFGSAAFDDGTAALAAWLKANSDQNTTWDLVVPNSQGGSRLIAQYGLSVMSLGGFLGRDNTISVSKFADLVESGEVRYVLASGGLGAAPRGNFFARGVLPRGGGRSFGSPPAIAGAASSGPGAVLAAVARACIPVSGPTLPAANRGSLYDCSGSAAALRGGTVASNTTL